jgi:hypothetical protein
VVVNEFGFATKDFDLGTSLMNLGSDLYRLVDYPSRLQIMRLLVKTSSIVGLILPRTICLVG